MRLFYDLIDRTSVSVPEDAPSDLTAKEMDAWLRRNIPAVFDSEEEGGVVGFAGVSYEGRPSILEALSVLLPAVRRILDLYEAYVSDILDSRGYSMLVDVYEDFSAIRAAVDQIDALGLESPTVSALRERGE